MIFLSGDSTNHIDLSKEIGIPPVYTVENSKLSNDTGKIIQQVFFMEIKMEKNLMKAF